MEEVHTLVRRRYDAMFPKPQNCDTLTLRRYLSTGEPNKFEWLLRESKVWLSKASEFPDQLEATLPPESQAIFRRWEARMTGSFDAVRAEQIHKEIRESLFASSWNKGKNESIWMWQVYCPRAKGVEEFTGVLIQTTFAKLEAACLADGGETFQIGVVQYVPDVSKFVVPLDNIYWRIMYKDHSFAVEDEVRVAVYGDPANAYMAMEISLLDVVEEIRVHPLASQVYFDAIKTLTESVNPDLSSRVKWSSLRESVTEKDFIVS